MTRQNNDNRAVPKGTRKDVPIPAKTGGGKAIADDEQTFQFELFTGPAEKDRRRSARSGSGGNRKPQAPHTARKPGNKKGKGMSATMECILDQIEDAYWNVMANKGSPGPNRQTIAEVRTHWREIRPRVKAQLEAGTYQVGNIRRVWIPKSSGGKRGLGIPDVIDRIVQEAVRMVLEPLYEPGFHPSSHGFRPKRGCQTAIEQAKSILATGYQTVVDIDLENFFNSVNHQRLMAKLAQRVSDRRVLKLIGAMLKAKVVMPDGVVIPTEQGVPQGGPLSPLLSNIYLDELDWELERRGHRFVRYADDCNIYVRSERSGHRVMESLRRFIEGRMRLKMNEKKSAVARPSERHFLGFTLRFDAEKGTSEVALSARTHERIRERIRELTPRNFGNSISRCIGEINIYLRGWINFFGICTQEEEMKLRYLDAHIRRRLRAIRLKQWKRKRSMVRGLVRRGVKAQTAANGIYGARRNIWALSHIRAVERGLSNAFWAEQGLQSLQKLWKQYQESHIASVQTCLELT
jgi:RNA-directed DNA polymerase